MLLLCFLGRVSYFPIPVGHLLSFGSTSGGNNSLQGQYVKFKLLQLRSLHNRLLVRMAGVEGGVVAVEEVVGSPLTQNLLVTRQV